MGFVQWAWLTWRDYLFEVEVRGAEQDLIPYVEQLVYFSVPVEGWVIVLYEHSFLDGPNNGMQLSIYSGEILQFGMMT